MNSFLHSKIGLPLPFLSQNFLLCDDVVELIMATLVRGPRKVTELGSGTGVVTVPLLEKGFAVRATEKDEQLVEILKKRVRGNTERRLELHAGDLRDIPWEHAEPYQLVGNIPYHLSGLILRRVTQLQTPPEQVVLLIQKEVGERIAAQPPDLNLISLAIQMWGEVRQLQDVPRTCFEPVPKVDSQLVLLKPHRRDGIPLIEREEIMRVANILFRGRRKQIAGSLKRSFHLSETRITNLLHNAGIVATQRPQELTIPQWRALTHSLQRTLA
jgi:16S rRNA (adenine1518-N6/adenine1519-N6)-dimethyltransferase